MLFIPALCAYDVMMESFRTWALDVADDASGGIVHELNSDLRNTSTRTSPSEDLECGRVFNEISL